MIVALAFGLSMGALSQNLYTMIVTMAVITTMAMHFTMLRAPRWPALPMSKEEEVRIEREAIDERRALSPISSGF